MTASERPSFDIASFLLDLLELDDLMEEFQGVPRDNRAGGVGYHWYFVGGHYLKRHPGLDPAAWQERVSGFAQALAGALAVSDPGVDQEQAVDGWNDLRAYVRQTLTVEEARDIETQPDSFAAELDRYRNAKRRGRGTTSQCSLCSSSFKVAKQREAATLFAPQVYSNKLPLHGSNAIRDICSICSLEMMLRQILMNRSRATGGDFEGRRTRYLYFYPTYFFTPETLEVMRRLYTNLKRISFTELRRQLIGRDGSVSFGPATWQRLEPLLLAPDEELDAASDRELRFHFPEHEPVTFYFMGVPAPGRDPTEAESWIHPAFLALMLPLCLDVKVVASASPVPLLLEADELPETVLLDGAHAFVRHLVGPERVNVDQLLPSLQRLATGYLIHLDAKSGTGARGWDYRWRQIPAVARALNETPLAALHFLKQWQRGIGADGLPLSKVRQYLTYVDYMSKGSDEMSHARQLTSLYRQFYRARRRNSSSILRPITVASRAVLKADPHLFDEEGMVEVVRGELHSFATRASRENLAYFPRGSDHASRETAMRAFAVYFVDDVFRGVFRGDVSALRGKQLNLLKSACEVIYRDQDAREWKERGELENKEKEA